VVVILSTRLISSRNVVIHPYQLNAFLSYLTIVKQTHLIDDKSGGFLIVVDPLLYQILLCNGECRAYCGYQVVSYYSSVKFYVVCHWVINRR